VGETPAGAGHGASAGHANAGNVDARRGGCGICGASGASKVDLMLIYKFKRVDKVLTSAIVASKEQDLDLQTSACIDIPRIRMTCRRPMPRAGGRFTHLLAIAIALAWASAAVAQDAPKVKAGLEVWKSSGCSECHGPFADGSKENDDAPEGANLRQTRLDNAAMAETIRCGRPGAGMPSFDPSAYIERGCNGEPPGPRPEDTLYPAPRNLSAADIDAVVAYLRARIIGRGEVTPEECADYYGERAASFCDDAPK
jgi:mono/diheme cytochrome c family protein